MRGRVQRRERGPLRYSKTVTRNLILTKRSFIARRAPRPYKFLAGHDISRSAKSFLEFIDQRCFVFWLFPSVPSCCLLTNCCSVRFFVQFLFQFCSIYFRAFNILYILYQVDSRRLRILKFCTIVASSFCTIILVTDLFFLFFIWEEFNQTSTSGTRLVEGWS